MQDFDGRVVLRKSMRKRIVPHLSRDRTTFQSTGYRAQGPRNHEVLKDSEALYGSVLMGPGWSSTGLGDSRADGTVYLRCRKEMCPDQWEACKVGRVSLRQKESPLRKTRSFVSCPPLRQGDRDLLPDGSEGTVRGLIRTS